MRARARSHTTSTSSYYSRFVCSGYLAAAVSTGVNYLLDAKSNSHINCGTSTRVATVFDYHARSMHIMHLDYAVPIRVINHIRTYLFGFWCNYSIHVDCKYHNHIYVSIVLITIYIGTRNGSYQCYRSYQCCDYKVYSLHRTKSSHYAVR